MNEKPFVELCRKAVVDYHNSHRDKSNKTHGITVDDVYVVWLCKILENNKALLSTTIEDGMYYEATYNGDTGEVYLAAYKNWETIVVKTE